MPTSPGVYIREFDFSDYAPQLGVTLPAIIGGATKGPVGVPTLIQNEGDLVRAFGPPVVTDLGLQSAIRYLKQGNQLNYVRVAHSVAAGAPGGVNTAAVTVPGTLSGTPAIAATGTITFPTFVAGVGYTNPADGDTVTITAGGSVFTFEFDSNSAYVAGNNPVLIGATAGNTLDNLASAITARISALAVVNTTVSVPTLLLTAVVAGTAANVAITKVGTNVAVTGMSGGVNASTGSFGAAMSLSAISPGSWANGMQIQVVTPSTALNSATSSFDLLVFASNGTNGSVSLVERFSNLTMDTSASNYIVTALTQGIANVAGPSQYIAAVPLATATGLQAGTYTMGATGAAATGSIVITANPVDTDKLTLSDGITSVVFEFDNNAAVTAGNTLVTIGGTAILTATALVTAINSAFGFGVTASNVGGTSATITLANDLIGTNGNIAIVKAWATPGNCTVTGMTGGTGTVGTDGITGLAAADYIGTVNGQSATGIQALRNADTVEMNLLAIPGVTNSAVINAALGVATARGDFLYLIDTPFGLTVQGVIDWTNGKSALPNAPAAAIDSSYAAIFWPWIQVTDAYSGKTLWLPPSGSVLAAMAYTDKTAGPWYAVAGSVRGVITGNKIEYSASQSERDSLIGAISNNRVNPIVNLNNRALTIYGNRTTQRRPSGLDSIHIRRMLLHAEKICATATQYLVFNPNDPQTWREFTARVNPQLEAIKAARGLGDFRVICDASTNPPAQISQHVMRAKLLLQPIDAAEIILLDFAVLANGADFSSANF